jgi:hypothetical protein
MTTTPYARFVCGNANRYTADRKRNPTKKERVRLRIAPLPLVTGGFSENGEHSHTSATLAQ